MIYFLLPLHLVAQIVIYFLLPLQLVAQIVVYFQLLPYLLFLLVIYVQLPLHVLSLLVVFFEVVANLAGRLLEPFVLAHELPLPLVHECNPFFHEGFQFVDDELVDAPLATVMRVHGFPYCSQHAGFEIREELVDGVSPRRSSCTKSEDPRLAFVVVHFVVLDCSWRPAI